MASINIKKIAYGTIALIISFILIMPYMPLDMLMKLSLLKIKSIYTSSPYLNFSLHNILIISFIAGITLFIKAFNKPIIRDQKGNKVLILTSEGGNGHKSAAESIKKEFQSSTTEKIYVNGTKKSWLHIRIRNKILILLVICNVELFLSGTSIFYQQLDTYIYPIVVGLLALILMTLMLNYAILPLIQKKFDIGVYGVNSWNNAQKKGYHTKLKKLADHKNQKWFFLFRENVSKKLRANISKNDTAQSFTLVDTQPLFSELTVSELAAQAKNNPGIQYKYIKVITDFINPNETTFTANHFLYSLRKINYNKLPENIEIEIRVPGPQEEKVPDELKNLLLLEKHHDKKNISVVYKMPIRQDFLPEELKKIEKKASTSSAFIMLGSQASCKDTIDKINSEIKKNTETIHVYCGKIKINTKNLGLDTDNEQNHNLFTIKELRDYEATLTPENQEKLQKQIDESLYGQILKLPKQEKIKPFDYKEGKEIAEILLSVDRAYLRPGGLSTMEALSIALFRKKNKAESLEVIFSGNEDDLLYWEEGNKIAFKKMVQGKKNTSQALPSAYLATIERASNISTAQNTSSVDTNFSLLKH